MRETKLEFSEWIRARLATDGATGAEPFGEAFRAAFESEVDVEKSGWAVDLAKRAATRVQSCDEPEARKLPVVYWSKERTAFTLPGRYIYLSRTLLEEALPEDAVAFVFAHELAHHRLDHIERLVPALESSSRLLAGSLLPVAARALMRLATSPEKEAEADAWALSRCLELGCDGRACLRLFDVMTKLAADRGDLHMAYGHGDVERLAERQLRREKQSRWQNALDDIAQHAARLRWERVRGYPSLPDRRAKLESILARSR
jgi:predicted Zn-dependent protease